MSIQLLVYSHPLIINLNLYGPTLDLSLKRKYSVLSILGCSLIYLWHLSGVFAQEVIPPRTCFGPMVGQHCSNVDLSDWPEKDTPQVWKVGAIFFS